MKAQKSEFTDGRSITALFAKEGIDITPNRDKGVCKMIKQKGTEGQRPMIGDKVFVHYTGKLLNGKKFDSSIDRKEPFSFNVGKGQMIKAWDVCVTSMQKGEICTVLCKPEYAYGTTGNPPKIPPNSSLLFEVELLDFTGEVLTEDGGIVRRIKVKGEGFNNPNDGATVHVHLEGTCGGRTFESRDVSFIVGEAEDVGVPLGVDRAMEKMQRGECCLLYLEAKYGFGVEGRPKYGIGPNADVVYEVTLKDFVKAKESWEMDLTEKLEQSLLVKQKGTHYFKAGRYQHAVIQYQRIVFWLEMECGVSKDQQKAIQDLLIVAHLNLALCYLRLCELTHVVDNCNKVIDIDVGNEKALYRRAMARLQRNEFSLALRDFRQVLQVNPSNRAANSQISICQSKMREHHEHDKKIYANMFQRFAEHDAKIQYELMKHEKTASPFVNLVTSVSLKVARRKRKREGSIVCNLSCKRKQRRSQNCS